MSNQEEETNNKFSKEISLFILQKKNIKKNTIIK